MGKFESKKTVLVKKINNVIYELLVKSHSDMVYVDDTTTLTEKLNDIANLLTTSAKDIEDIQEKYKEIVGDAPESFNTFKEVWDYLNINGDPKSELIKLIDSKVSKEPGKGLSANDFTDFLYKKLNDDYSKEELDEKFETLVSTQNGFAERLKAIEEERNIILSMDGTVPEGVKDGDMWFCLVSKDN